MTDATSTLIKKLRSELATLRHEHYLATVRRDVLAAACRGLLGQMSMCYDKEVERYALEALALTPERAASVIEENKRLREVLLAQRMSWSTPEDPCFDEGCNVLTKGHAKPCLLARQALAATKGDSE